MTPAPLDPEDNLGKTLARQADRFTERGGSPLDLEQVLSRAGKIRRGRRARASIAMAAVVIAVAVPVGISVVGNDPTKNPSPPIATSSPTKPPEKADSNPIALGQLKTGDAPKNGYYDAGKLYYDGKSVPLAGQTPANVVRMDGGFLIAQSPKVGGDLVAKFVGDDGQVLDQTWPTTGSIVTSPDRTTSAFVQPDGTVIYVEAGAARFGPVGKIPGAGPFDVDAIVGENCAGRGEDVGCTVYVHSSGQDRQVWAISPHVAAEQVFPGMQELNGTTRKGLVIGQTSATDNGSCSQLLTKAGDKLWQNCDYSFVGFSPDGRYLLAAPPGDGSGQGGIVIIDAETNDTVLYLQAATDNNVQQLEWEDSTHVLASVYDHGKFAVERFALNGAREYATRTVPDSTDSMVTPLKLG